MPADRTDDFLGGDVYAVVGASRDRSKYGNRVLRAYLAHGFRVVPVNPNEKEVEGIPAVPDLASLPEPVHGVSVITQPEVSERIVAEAGALGIRRVWLQPGAESPRTARIARDAGVDLIQGGPCVLVERRALAVTAVLPP